MQNAVLLVLLYIVGFPIILQLIFFAHKQLIVKRAIEKNDMRKQPKPEHKLPKPMAFRFHKMFGFELKDTRSFSLNPRKPGTGSLQNRHAVLIVWALGLVLMLAGAFTGKGGFIVASAVAYFVCVLMIASLPKKVLRERESRKQRMYDVMSRALGYSKENSMQNDLTVLEWRDLVTPEKVQFTIPTSFSDSNEDGALKSFNQFFGRESAWVASFDKEKDERGWDYEKLRVIISSVPPLPQKAMWDEHYVINDDIAWSFFPLGIAVENGVELPNPNKGGEIENVVGFDVAGLQQDKKLKGSQKYVASPQALVGGATGGGKALDERTPILAIRSSSASSVAHHVDIAPSFEGDLTSPGEMGDSSGSSSEDTSRELSLATASDKESEVNR